jgi:hypothetical protein
LDASSATYGRFPPFPNPWAVNHFPDDVHEAAELDDWKGLVQWSNNRIHTIPNTYAPPTSNGKLFSLFMLGGVACRKCTLILEV